LCAVQREIDLPASILLPNDPKKVAEHVHWPVDNFRS